MGVPNELPELPLEPGTRVIGDLHLDVSGRGEPAALEHFSSWLAGLREVPRLVILGDLFDAWIGPAQLGVPAAGIVIEALRALTQGGTAVDVVPGNRDFLLEERFEQASGARVRAAGCVGTGPAGARTLLIHGDELCTRDLAYQRLRRVLRSAPVRWSVPRIPRPVGLWAARRLRGASVQAVAAKPSEHKALQPAAAVALAAQHRCQTLVCGHAHVFRDERLEDGLRWMVVGAFGAPQDVLECGPEGGLGPRSPEGGLSGVPGGPAGGRAGGRPGGPNP